MSDPKDTIIECECDACDADFDICISDDFREDPLYCPFCGNELPEEDMYEDEEEEEDDFDELDFDDDYR